MNLGHLMMVSDPFLDNVGKAYAHIPRPEGEEGQEVLLNGNEFRAWMRKELHLMLKQLPSDKQLAQALEIMFGHALQQPRRNPTVEHKDDTPLPPLGQVIEHIFNNEGPTSLTPSDLAKKCLRVADRLGVLKTTPDFPDNEDKLGNQLVDLIPVMAQRGIVLDRDPKERPRKWTIDRKIDTQPLTSSPQPRSDGSDAKVLAVNDGEGRG